MRKVKLIILFIIIFLAGFLIANGIKYSLDTWRADRNVQVWQKGIDNIFANDTYGGATPEETFDLYLAALKKGDLELASKYFVFEKQGQRLEMLKKEKDMENYIKEVESISQETWKKTEENDDLTVEYAAFRTNEREVEIMDNNGTLMNKILPIGKYNGTMAFKKINNLWKLHLL